MTSLWVTELKIGEVATCASRGRLIQLCNATYLGSGKLRLECSVDNDRWYCLGVLSSEVCNVKLQNCFNEDLLLRVRKVNVPSKTLITKDRNGRDAKEVVHVVGWIRADFRRRPNLSEFVYSEASEASDEDDESCPDLLEEVSSGGEVGDYCEASDEAGPISVDSSDDSADGADSKLDGFIDDGVEVAPTSDSEESDLSESALVDELTSALLEVNSDAPRSVDAGDRLTEILPVPEDEAENDTTTSASAAVVAVKGTGEKSTATADFAATASAVPPSDAPREAPALGSQLRQWNIEKEVKLEAPSGAAQVEQARLLGKGKGKVDHRHDREEEPAEAAAAADSSTQRAAATPQKEAQSNKQAKQKRKKRPLELAVKPSAQTADGAQQVGGAAEESASAPLTGNRKKRKLEEKEKAKKIREDPLAAEQAQTLAAAKSAVAMAHGTSTSVTAAAAVETEGSSSNVVGTTPTINDVKNAAAKKKQKSAERPNSGKEVGLKKKLPGGVIYTVKTIGNGGIAGLGSKVRVKYEGRLASNGKNFDKGVLTFTIGAGEMIKGFDVGVNGMLVGEKRLLYIPARMGYGAQKTGPIPANSDLLFDVELVAAH